VPAGNERFEIGIQDRYMKDWTNILTISWKDFLGHGRVNVNDDRETFCMTVLALKLSAYANGVAKLHGVVSRHMWKDIWPGLPIEEVPIHHVTNGVHPKTWIYSGMKYLLDRYLGPEFEEKPTDLTVWNKIDRISDEELWRTHERRRERLVSFVRDRTKERLPRFGGARAATDAEDCLSPNVLTICFARRFATYKRGNLLLRDPERLLRLLRDKDHPIQLVFAGKAHPHDMPGKELIKSIVHFAEQNGVTNRIVFVENYDMTVAKYLTSGADVWLNTPRRPLEASGTSGMKAAMNGVLNCSILDGWWDEAYDPALGWAIGHGEIYTDEKLQDDIESKDLYDILEHEIIPLFYKRGRDGLPREWIKMMKTCMVTIGQSMSCQRMLMDYSNSFYLPALKNYKEIKAEDYRQAKNLAAYFDNLKNVWGKIGVTKVESNAKPVMQAGNTLSVTAYVNLPGVDPKEISVQLYHGQVSSVTGVIANAEKTEMKCAGKANDKANPDLYKFTVKVGCGATGYQGHTVRIMPKHEGLVHPYRPGLVKWA
jgi:starch phosphorylase